MQLTIPEFSVIALIGASGSGKSSFAKKHFLPTEVISSDFCRGLVSDDENNQEATPDAFEVLYYLAGKRLENFKLTVIDATNVQFEDRKGIIKLAREHHCLPVAIVLNVPKKICYERNKRRSNRNFGSHVIARQTSALRRSLKRLKREGFRHVYILNSVDEIESVTIERTKLWNNLKDDKGPFDIIGDIHGCYDELETLLKKLGYKIKGSLSVSGRDKFHVQPPKGRKVIFLGDLVDRGPKSPDVLRLVMKMVEEGNALCIPGNHDNKLQRKLSGRDVQITYGLGETLEQLDNESSEFVEQVKNFIYKLISHYVLDEGKLVVAHAGMKENLQGRGSRTVREFALFGETTGETDEFGLPIRYPWADEYRGKATVVYGHTPVPECVWINNTINIDTGCAFGGKLTALRYPERELISVHANHTYSEPAKKFLAEDAQAPKDLPRQDYLLDINDVTGKRIISTRFARKVTLKEENAIAALEVISRFAVNPRWLIYLPPTMSPTSTSDKEDYLEYPTEAFSYYRNRGVPKVICEEKHMGSRAIVIVCKDNMAVREKFGVDEEDIGICYTRTGRRFFNDLSLESEFLQRMQNAISESNLWESLQTDWVILDCELMPWSAKAQELLKRQYAAVGAAARPALAESLLVLEQASNLGEEIGSLLIKYREQSEMVDKFIQAYRQYCWPVNSITDLKLAPFNIMASEGRVHIDKDHEWHIKTIESICNADQELLLKTEYKIVDVTSEKNQKDAIDWWENIISNGGEGMVSKPIDFIAKDKRELIQPSLKTRGREYLRIIYGPEYSRPENLKRLKNRSVARKRALAEREFGLGIEALERFTRHEPLYRVHECVFGILALESNPVDPRL